MILKDRIALVTGAAGGIGQAICTALAAEGATIAVHYHKQEAAALGLVAELGGGATAFQADITAADQAQSLVDRVVERMGGIDIMINNAGITIGGQSVVDMPLEDWHKVIDVNLHSVLYMSKAALPYMRKRQDGAVVNIASNVVNTLPGGAAAYATTKAGVVALTKVLSKEEAQHGIRVNAISPGYYTRGHGRGRLTEANAGNTRAVSQYHPDAPFGRGRRGRRRGGLFSLVVSQLCHGAAYECKWRGPHRILPIVDRVIDCRTLAAI